MLLTHSLNEIGAMLADEMAGVHRLVVGAGLGNFLSIDIDHEAVRDTQVL